MRLRGIWKYDESEQKQTVITAWAFKALCENKKWDEEERRKGPAVLFRKELARMEDANQQLCQLPKFSTIMFLLIFHWDRKEIGVSNEKE